MTESELREEIRATFPSETFHGTVTECKCEECTDISTYLRGRAWTDVSDEFVRLTCSPNLLTNEAFHAFVPAYLLRALDGLTERHDVVLEFTIYNLTPPYFHEDEEEDEEYRQERILTCGNAQIY